MPLADEVVDRVATALRESLEAHEAEVTFAYSKGHHYGGEISVRDVAAGIASRLKLEPPGADQRARWKAVARLGAFEDLARELVARWRDGVAERTEAEIVDAFEALLAEKDRPAHPLVVALRDALDDLETYEESAGRNPWNLRSYRDGSRLLGRRPDG